jgi:hypothetical protein
MTIGVSCDEYWHGDYTNLQHYVRAHELQNEQRNQEMWLQGLYTFRAVKAVIEAFSWGLGGGKGKRPDGYIDRPIRLTPLSEEEKKQNELRQAKSVINEFDAWGDRLNAQKQK